MGFSVVLVMDAPGSKGSAKVLAGVSGRTDAPASA
jgi:hypothetical protein